MQCYVVERASIDIRKVKLKFATKFPEHPLTKILLSEPDMLTADEFIAKAQTWLAFFSGDGVDGKE